MESRPTIDASKLPDVAWDAHAPLWWGNLLLLLIETTSMVLLIATYFYVRRNFWEWPPPRVNEMPVIGHPVPRLGAGTLNLVLLLASCVPMYWTDQAARRVERRKVILGLTVMSAIAVLSLWLRWHELWNFHFRWDENAYGSAVWWILVMHAFYLLSGLAEFGIMLLWGLLHPIEEKHGLDVTLMGGFWYWVAGVWAITYVVLYWYPRWS
jgi:heme/copper-type cytochrome/quinol oxidase subunit 3